VAPCPVIVRPRPLAMPDIPGATSFRNRPPIGGWLAVAAGGCANLRPRPNRLSTESTCGVRLPCAPWGVARSRTTFGVAPRPDRLTRSYQAIPCRGPAFPVPRSPRLHPGRGEARCWRGARRWAVGAPKSSSGPPRSSGDGGGRNACRERGPLTGRVPRTRRFGERRGEEPGSATPPRSPGTTFLRGTKAPWTRWYDARGRQRRFRSRAAGQVTS